LRKEKRTLRKNSTKDRKLSSRFKVKVIKQMKLELNYNRTIGLLEMKCIRKLVMLFKGKRMKKKLK